MLKARFTKYTLHFRQPSGTSRGIYTTRDTWFIEVFDTENPEVIGIGECAPLPGLSRELKFGFIEKFTEVCANIESYKYPIINNLEQFSSIRMGVETALIDLQQKANQVFFSSDFTEGKKGIKINGLVWMGTPEFMRKQVQEKINEGYNCIKLKIGAIDFETELAIINEIRNSYSHNQIQIRVDANGAFSPNNVMEKLEALAKLNVHSIEQPIQPKQLKQLAYICKESPIPIALDEELLEHYSFESKKQLLEEVRPHFLILKPSLHGGFSGCSEWISIANEHKVGWWVTSALESNVGLNAIAQWTATMENNLHQGLGTGQLYKNNFDSPLFIQSGQLFYNKTRIIKHLELK